MHFPFLRLSSFHLSSTMQVEQLGMMNTLAFIYMDKAFGIQHRSVELPPKAPRDNSKILQS